MFQLIRPDTQIDFVGKRKLWVGISVAAVLISIILLFTKGLNYGIDFSGGAEVQIKVPAGWDIGKVRSELETANLKGMRVQQIGEAAANEYLIKAQGDEQTLNKVSGQIEGTLSKSLKAGEYEIQRVDVVGPAAGSSLRKSGFLSMLYALLCILIYVTVRFDFRYAPGAVLALFHDAIITIGVFVVTQKAFDLQILAAVLALIGYSNNDTIIVYDRVRETQELNPGMSIEVAVNKATNETLSRTLLTTISTLIVVFSLWLLGGKVIQDFAFTLMVGMIAGAYSSIFVASAMVIFLTNHRKKRDMQMKNSGKQKRQITVRPEPKLSP